MTRASSEAGESEASEGRSAGAKYGLLAFKLALTALVAWFVWRSVDTQLAEVREIDWTAVEVNVPLLLLSVALLFGELAWASWLWAKLVQRLGGPRVPVPTAASIIVLANFGRYVPGKVLHIAGVAVLAERARCPAPVATAASLLCQLMHLLGAAIVGGSTILRLSGVSFHYAAAAGAALLIALVGLARRRRVQAALTWALGQIGRRQRSDLALDARSIAGLAPLPWIAAFVGKWFVYGLAFLLLAKSIGADGSLLFYATVFAGAYLTGYLAVLAPAGVGVREATMVAMLAPALGSGASVVLAVAQRAWITAFELIAAPGSVAVFWRRSRKA